MAVLNTGCPHTENTCFEAELVIHFVLFTRWWYCQIHYLDSIDELQRLEAQIAATKEQLTATSGQAARQVSANSRQILSLEAQLVALQEQERNLTLVAQQPGEVFNLSVGTGSVIGSGAEVMRIIPDGGGLKAKVFLPNSELGFIKDGMPVKLAVSSFPLVNMDIKRHRKSIGADALESTDPQSANRQRANTFPMTIALKETKTNLQFFSSYSRYAGLSQHYCSSASSDHSPTDVFSDPRVYKTVAE